MKNTPIFFALLVLVCLTGCGGCNRNNSRPKPDTSSIKLTVKMERFDQDFAAFKNADYNTQADFMRSKYGPFFDFYVSRIVIGPRPGDDTTNIDEPAVKKFIADSYINRIQDSIDYYFKSTADIDAQLTQSFKYLKYYFPQIQTPHVIGVNSGFSLGAFTYQKDVLGIGLDLYFGTNNPDYDSAGIYQYLQHKMRREYISRNAMEVLYNLYFGDEEASRGKPLIEAMVDKGKKLFFISYMLPDAPDSMIAGFTQKQTKWCEANEYEIWKYLNEKDLLYNQSYMDQKRYLDEGPTTSGMPAESPGNIGGWIGLQIVRRFMKETDGKIPLNELITRYSAKAIIDKARYRPSKSVF
ncbi:MAG TPA: hypothetical protein VG603_09240 [Chitinophagales bacterium]|nr:hypothetical protein [Chitinophagales bacterium]